MTGVQWLDDDQQRIWRAWLRATHRVQSYLDADLRREGLDLAEYEILVTLSEAPEQQLRMSELAHAVSQSRSRLTHTIKRLEARGHAERINCADDGRGVLAALTPAGVAFLEDVAPGHVSAVRRIIIDVVEPSDLETLGRACEAILNVPDYDGGS
ncbi:MAG: MarR family transcriptional regulator [Propionibacteriaceae bacterium]|nr:MarR family transcriptional regulator [Propionibacteriaceae bacterium]